MQYQEFVAFSALAMAPVPGAIVTVKNAGQASLATIYNLDGQAMTNPTTASPQGVVGLAVADGFYDLVIQTPNGSPVMTLHSVQFYDGRRTGQLVDALSAQVNAGLSAYGSWLTLPGNAGKSVSEYIDSLKVKGDPGGNAMAIGLFTAAPGISIPGGTDAVRTSGYSVRGLGIADYIYDPAVNGAYVSANPRTSFVTANGRGFRLVVSFLVDVRRLGAICDGTTDDTGAVAAANALAGTDRMLVFPDTTLISSLTISAMISDTTSQIFTMGAELVIDNGRPVRPEWFGIGNRGCVNAAVECLPQPEGGVVLLEDAVYPPCDHAYTGATTDARYMGRQNVKIQGAKMPRFSPDCRSLTGGSIIQGLFIAYADGLEISNVGFDSGRLVSDALFGGVEWDGLVCTYPSQQMKDASELRRGLKLDNVIALCARPNSPVHAMIAGEGYTDVQCTREIVGCYGVHGVVFKCTKVRAQSIASYLNDNENLIIKSDVQTTARSGDIRIDKVAGDNASGPPGTFPYLIGDPTSAATLYFHVQSASIDGVQIGEVWGAGSRATVAVGWGGDYVLASVQIGKVYSDQGGVRARMQALHPDNPGLSGAPIMALSIEDGGSQGTGSIQRFHIQDIDARNTQFPARFSFHRNASGLDRVSIGRLCGVNVDYMTQIRKTSYVDIQHVEAANVGTAIYLIEDTPSLKVGMRTRDGSIAAEHAGALWSLGAAWVNIPGNDPLSVSLGGGETILHGLIQPGSGATNKVAQLPQWAWPESVKRFVCQGRNATGMTFVGVAVATDGGVYVNEVGAGTANCSEWLSLEGCRW